MQTWNNCGAVCRLFKISSSVKIFNNLIITFITFDGDTKSFNETSLCTLENNGTKCVTSTTGIWPRWRLSMERVMKVMIRLIEYFDRARYFEQSTAPQLFHVCTSLSSNQISQNGLQSLLTLTYHSKRRLHRDVGLLLATHQAVTKHSSGLLIHRFTSFCFKKLSN